MTTDRSHSIDFQQAVIVSVKGDPLFAATPPHVELDLTKFQSGRWALQLDAVFARRREPAVILTQGVACLAVAWWAQLSPRSYMAAIRGAVFLSPLDIGFGQAGMAAAARLGPATRLPFPSVVVSASYPFSDRMLALADSWGSRLLEWDGGTQAGSTNRHAPYNADEARLIEFIALLNRDSPTAKGRFTEDATPAWPSIWT